MDAIYTQNIHSLFTGSFTSQTINYSIVNPISSGASGTVSLIKCPQFAANKDKLLAVKVFHKDNLDEIHDEIPVFKKLLTQIDHDFIMKAYGYANKLDDYSLIYLEYLGKMSLFDYMFRYNKQSPSIYQLVFTLAEVSEALSMLHSIGIIHQDIKLNNIVIRENGHLAICDFGSASIADNPNGVFERNITGCSIHLAPEISNPSIEYMDHAVDYYSLGVLICNMIDYKSIPNPSHPSYNYESPKTFAFIPKPIRKSIAALMNPNRYNRLCYDGNENISLLLEPGIKNIIWPKLGLYLTVYEIKDQIRALSLESPFQYKFEKTHSKHIIERILKF